MSFASKKLKASDVKSVPYVANKQYEIQSSSYSDLGIQTFFGEYIHITDRIPFDPENDNLTPDGKYRRLVYESVRHLYYQNYVTKSSVDQGLGTVDLLFPSNSNYFWHSSSYDNYEQNTMASGSYPNRREFPFYSTVQYEYDNVSASFYGTAEYFLDVASKIRVVSFPKSLYGEGLKQNTFSITGSEYHMRDDGNGNLIDVDTTPPTHVGNIFYNHGIAVITNKDYLCFLETAPVARNDFYTYLNTQEEKLIYTLAQDFDDCLVVATGSVNTFPHPDFSFPAYTVSASGDLIITPNASSVIPGEYRIYYTVKNLSDIESNTGSIVLRIESEPLTVTTQSLTQSCYEGNESASLTFSIDYGVPPYSWSLDGTNYNILDDLFQPTITASIIPTQSFILYVKDKDDTIVTTSLNTSFTPIEGRLWQNDVSNCGTNDGSIIVSASGDGVISASLSASFSNSLECPNEFTNLTTGSYTIYFQDSNLCTTSSTIEVTKTIPVTASYTVTHIDCYGGNTGKIILDELDSNDTASDSFLTGGAEPLTWSWAGPDAFTSTSVNIINLVTGSYILNITDNDGCNYPFTFDVTSSPEISYQVRVLYDNPNSSSLSIFSLNGGEPPYQITASTSITQYVTSSQLDIDIPLTEEELNSASITLSVTDSLGCTTQSTDITVYGRAWEVTASFCEDGTGSVAQRNLNFYTYEETGSEWVTVKIHSGSETPVEFATSGSATGSFAWNTTSTLYIDIYTGSNDNFYLRREFSGSNFEETGPASITGSEVTNSVILTGSGRMDHIDSNLDVSLAFGPNYGISSLHLTASKITTEDLTTNINFKFDKQIPLSTIKSNFIAEASNLATTGSNGSGSNFIARNDQFTDVIYGNTGSFIGPNKKLFRSSYAFGNILNTISGSYVEYTSGSIWSGSVSASIFGGENAYYFTQRTDKVWLLTADIDHIGYLEAYSYTDKSYYENDPIGTRTNLDPYTHREYTIYAGSQREEEDLMYIMIIHEDEDANMPLQSGIGGGEIFTRRLRDINDVNRVYYLFMSPSGSSATQADLDNRAVAIGKYFIDNVIYG